MQHNFTILSLCQRLITEEAKLRFYIPPKISKFPSNQLYLKTFQLLFFIHLLKRLIRQPRVSSVLKLVLLGTLSTERICDADGRPEVQVCIINFGCPWLPSWPLVLLTFPTTNCGKSRFVETTACFSIVSFLKVRKSWREPMINTNEC